MGSSWARSPPLPSSHFCWNSSRDVCVILKSDILKKKKKKKIPKQKLRKDSSSSSACVICVKTQLLVDCVDCRATAIRAACNCRPARRIWTNLPETWRWWFGFLSSIHWRSRLKQGRAFFSSLWLERCWDNAGTWGQPDRMSHTTPLIVIMMVCFLGWLLWCWRAVPILSLLFNGWHKAFFSSPLHFTVSAGNNGRKNGFFSPDINNIKCGFTLNSHAMFFFFLLQLHGK